MKHTTHDFFIPMVFGGLHPKHIVTFASSTYYPTCLSLVEDNSAAADDNKNIRY